MPTDTGPAPLMTVEAVCAYLGVSKDYVYDEVRCRRLRASKFARQLRFRPQDVDEFIDQNVVSDAAV
jgi:excisionase family DNA binding protein